MTQVIVAQRKASKRGLKAAALLLGLVIVSLSVWSFVIEPQLLALTTVEVHVPNWETSNSGLRIALLADLHVGSPFQDIKKLRKIVAKTNAARPDLILVLGDVMSTKVLGGRKIPPRRIAQELAQLDAPLGVFAVLGNHDWWHGGPQVIAALSEAGITVLEDSAVRVSGEKRFWLVGVGDYWETQHDIKAATRSVPAGESMIVFTHNPDIFPQVPQRAAITLAGHTHGGQVRLPIVGPLIVPSIFGTLYASGHIIQNKKHLYVASGIGTSILPVRFRVRPSIVVIKLESQGSVER